MEIHKTTKLIVLSCVLYQACGAFYYSAPTYNRRPRISTRSRDNPFISNPHNSYNSPPRQDMCSVNGPNDIRRILPGRFMSETDLLAMVPTSFNAEPHASSYRSVKKIVVSRFTESGFSKPGTSPYINDGICGCCVTELSYEIVEQITDFDGNNHTIINFNNAYQFIPSGRCSNENAPCAGGTARCKQVTRAHWSLVWTPAVGARLVAHEVPSHCQCINLGAASSPPARG
ncbi:hypothetical protein SNE40_004940 [Patella caerulea]|uniref:Uncharacterized protein n=1 Tax=Patella caerulea TaxID=87958 RepID=A0AAN8PYR9_PATCE